MKNQLAAVNATVPAICLAMVFMVMSGCHRADEANLLHNPDFDVAPDGGVASWSFTQHAGEPSYRFVSEGRALVIERVGIEPWGQATQTLPADGFEGRTLEFSAEISGDLDDKSGAPISSTGIGVRIGGVPPGMPAALGSSILLVRAGEPSIGPGKHGWTRQSVILEIPDGADEINLTVRMALDGVLRLRNPRLVERTP